jgi:hypothetical protein
MALNLNTDGVDFRLCISHNTVKPIVLDTVILRTHRARALYRLDIQLIALAIVYRHVKYLYRPV